jgi:ribosome-binding ATPase YchF (GTP1/OBG family)
MKIGVVGIESIAPGKANIVDRRVDALEKMFKSAKKVYIQVEIVSEQEKLKEADGIIAEQNAKLDLIVSDLEFVELRMERGAEATEKELLSRFKEQLDKEQMLSELNLNDEEKKIVSGYPLLTIKPVFFATKESAEVKDKLLFDAYYGMGYICFLTAGDKDAHAWSIKKGTTAWEASGAIHSAIQKGFIRAEVLSYEDLINAGSLNAARSAGKIHLENKDYVVKDGEYIEFRCNK